ncbi:MAG TPA: delta-60 repeat domain-containing protein, partial [Blastocatellia bacterium]
NGTVLTNFDSKQDVATSVAIQQDGKIVVGGISYPGTDGVDGDLSPASQLSPSNLSFVFVVSLTAAGGQMAVARYNSDGSPDSTFGNSGIVTTGIGETAGAFCLVIQQDNNIVLAGAGVPGSTIDFALARYEAGPLAGEFTLSPTEPSQMVEAGSSVEFTIDAQAVSGSTPPTSPVALTASVSPSGSGVTASFANSSVAVGASTTLDVATSATVTAGSYTITVTGTSGTVTQTTSVTVTVTSGPDFSIGFAAPSVTASPGTKVPITVLVSRTGGLTGKVTVAAPASLPSGITVKGALTATTKGTSVTFKLKIAASVGAGSDQLTFTGTDKNGQVRTGTLTLVIQ